MDKKQIKKKIVELGVWYQKIKFGSITTPGIQHTERLWNKIEKFFPESFVGLRVLDLGCNAGFYCVKASLAGAREVIGVERKLKNFQQALFVKKCFEGLYNKKLNIKYSNTDISNLDFAELGKFDVVFLLAILYHIGRDKFGKNTKGALAEQDRVIGELAKTSRSFVVRTRNRPKNNVNHYNNVFKKFDLFPLHIKKDDKRSLVLYKKRG